MLTENAFDEQIERLQTKFQTTFAPHQIVKIGNHFIGNPHPGILTLEFTDEQWRQRVIAHPVDVWVAEGAREFEVELVDGELTVRIAGAVGMKE